MKVLLTIHEMFYIIYEMIPKVSKAKGDYRIEQTAHLISCLLYTSDAADEL